MAFYEDIENQINNCINLLEQEDLSQASRQLAQILFTKPMNTLDKDITRIIGEDNIRTEDIFCTLTELVLYGLDILVESKYNIFDLESIDHPIINVLKTYIKSVGFDIIIREYEDPISEYRKRTDYYCELLSHLPPSLNDIISKEDGAQLWRVLTYPIICNSNFTFDDFTPLNKFQFMFLSKNNKIFMCHFKYQRI